jgi:hypothetical protein
MRLSKNTVLLIVFVTLLGVFVLSRVFRTPSLESNLEEHLLTLDTSEINAIHIRPSTEKGEIKLVRTGNSWQVEHDQKTANVEIAEVKNALATLREVHPERLVTRKMEKWADYNVDTTGTNVKVFTGKSDPTEFWVGKTSGGSNSIRLEGESDVFEVKETLDRTFNKKFAGWRNKTFLKLDPSQVSKITFQYPADSSFVVERSVGKWSVDEVRADSAKVQAYLNRFRSRNLSEFADDFKMPASSGYVVILQNDSATMLKLQGWKIEENKWIVTSSLQDSVYFSSSDKSLMNDLFASKNTFLPKE